MNEDHNNQNRGDNPHPEQGDSFVSREGDDGTSGLNEAEEEEFSLDQLSAAYAQVLKNRQPDGSPNDANEGVEPTEPSSSAPDHSPGSAGHPDRELVAREETEVENELSCPISPSSILESILFVGGPQDVKLTSRKIAAVMRDVSPKEITSLAKTLNKRYEQENRAYRIVSEKGALRMELHPDMLPLQDHILGRDRATKLTQQAIDVLAIVAYNQPVTRDQVDQIRSRPSGSIINQMVKRDLLRLEVIQSKPRQKRYWTTDRFLDLFGLESIDDLPQSHDVSDIDELVD